ncbi:hypothetical protein AKJ37_02730 [candidate division MSBL1 archaeon SCGC-AAA259I09]|uniref:Hydantoinase n=1 Tax=candidate division MSBL1 archaeon SCGC-AAA259I09 TaxID=1698267 RepID=A0A133UTU8_9EURY|nr:hypothetical protein AKJ37_02730 [candidate division MSBL1 archaeon SCGC-AAA259I09]
MGLIDIGGTNTDGVLLSEEGIEFHSKIPSTPNDVESIGKFFEILKTEHSFHPRNIDRIVIGTTLILNSAMEGKMKKCGCVLIPGPGLSPKLVEKGDVNETVAGYIDHRGRKVEDLDERSVERFGMDNRNDAETYAIVGKFSPRNPELENRASDLLDEEFVSKGNEVSPVLSFPLRVSTTVLNAKSKPVFNGFTRNIEKILEKLDVSAPLYFVKSDGAMLNLEMASKIPSITIKSGPAVSTLGLYALTGIDDALAIDIGGTTTDIGIIDEGNPRIEENLRIVGYDTAFSSVDSVDIPLGGDSLVELDPDSNQIQIRKIRKGPAAAFGGEYPTPTDALQVLGEFEAGDRDRAFEALSDLSEESGLDVEGLAERIVEKFCRKISDHLKEFIEEHDTLKLSNDLTFLGGGVLSNFLIPRIANRLGCDFVVPKYSEVAGAVGCAVSRVCLRTRIHIDTARSEMTVNGVQRRIERGKTMSEEKWIDLGREEVLKVSEEAGASFFGGDEVQVKSFRFFNVVERQRVRGQICDIEGQMKPGISDKVDLEKLRGRYEG